jgi:carbonic anhydrase
MKLPGTISTLLAAVAFCTASSLRAEGHHWSYGGHTGPAAWAALDHDFAACKLGHAQSPIDIRSATPADLPPIVFDYKPSPLRVIDNGHTVQVNYAPGSSISVGG